MVCVEHHWDTVGRGNASDIVSASDGTGDGRFLVLVFDTLPTV